MTDRERVVRSWANGSRRMPLRRDRGSASIDRRQGSIVARQAMCLAPGRSRSARNGRLRGAAAFTLLELLVSMLLASMVLALSYDGIRAVSLAVDRGHALAEEAREVSAAQDFLRRQLACARVSPLDPQAVDPVPFEGTRDHVRFVAPLPGLITSGGAHGHELALRADAGGDYALELRLTSVDERLPPGTDDRAVGAPETLLPHVRTLELAYQDRDERGNVRWRDRWDARHDREGAPRLPERVRVRSTRGPSARIVWPDLVVRLDPRGCVE